jgi:hypothetical protein
MGILNGNYQENLRKGVFEPEAVVLITVTVMSARDSQ